jgi:hypothetical protein
LNDAERTVSQRQPRRTCGGEHNRGAATATMTAEPAPIFAAGTAQLPGAIGFVEEICQRHGIGRRDQLRQWIVLRREE